MLVTRLRTPHRRLLAIRKLAERSPLFRGLWLGDGLLYFATFLAVFSAFQYVWDGSRAATSMETQVTDPA
jgi:hypothetical protein